MALIRRISRLFQADLHALLDHIEAPDDLLKQAIREMEDVLAEDQQRIHQLTQQHQQLTHQETDLQQSLNAIEAQLDICFSAQQDDLARLHIKRKLEMQQLSKTTQKDCIAVQNTLAKLTTELKSNQLQLDSMRQQADRLLSDTRCNDVGKHWQRRACSVRHEDVEVAFLHEKQIRSQP